MPFGLPGVASVPLTQVFDRFISLFHPSTMSVVGSMNCSQVSVMVSLEIGLAKMFECEMCPRLCVHCTKTAPPNHETQTSKTKRLRDSLFKIAPKKRLRHVCVAMCLPCGCPKVLACRGQIDRF